MKLRSRQRVLVFSLLLSLFVWIPSSWSGTFTVFGPQTYTRDSGNPVTVTSNFSVFNPNTTYTLEIQNGGLVDDEFEKVSSSIISLNGSQIVGPQEFNQTVSFIEKPVVVSLTNGLSVEVRGKPGGAISVSVIGVDNDPPVITATVTPAANTVGWHNEDVTVTFECSDVISGIASCPEPITTTSEGAGQEIQGTATDLAGNTATASVTIHIDKTPPQLTIDGPLDGLLINVDNPSIFLSFNDLISAVDPASIQISLDGAPLTGACTVSTVTAICTTSTLGEGLHQVSIDLQDLAGNPASASSSFTVEV